MYSTHTESRANLATRFARNTRVLRGDAPLSEDQMRAAAPSVFAEGKHASRSERYTYIPTIEVLRGLRKEGFEPPSTHHRESSAKRSKPPAGTQDGPPRRAPAPGRICAAQGGSRVDATPDSPMSTTSMLRIARRSLVPASPARGSRCLISFASTCARCSSCSCC